MKTSRFNIYFPHEDTIVWYNAYANDFLILDPELHNIFLDKKKEGLYKLNEIHPQFYNHLKNKGFIVNDELDEIQLVKKLVSLIDKEIDDSYEIIINPTMNCNFKCWYCYETHIKDSKINNNTFNSIILFITNILTKTEIKNFYLSWFGGEPLLYYNKIILPIMKKTSSLCKERKINFSSNFTTNGLLINEKMLLQCKKLGVSHFQITLDGHRKRHNQVRFISKEKGSYDEIVKNIKLILMYKMFVTVRLNISEETLDSNFLEIVKDFSDLTNNDKKFINFSFHRVWQEDRSLEKDIFGLLNWFKEHDFRVSIPDDTDSVKNSCYADKKNQATINYNGDVFKCTARNFTEENREGILTSQGKVLWNKKYENRMNSKFNNPPCLKCKILPICNGGCSQLAIENIGKDYCIYDFDQNKKLEIVKNKYLSIINQ